MTKTLLVAIDSSSIARQVLHAAREQCQATGSRMLLLRVVGVPVELPPEAYVSSPDTVADLLVDAARKQLENYAKELPAELVAGIIVEIGTPWRLICDLAAEHDVAMIVVGAHGHRFIDRVLGTTTGRVVAHADRTVLVVRAAMEATPATPATPVTREPTRGV
jgi:universal stress protein A